MCVPGEMMKADLYLLTIFVLVVAIACKSEPPETESEISKPEPLSRVLPSVPTDTGMSPPKPVPPVTEAEARALLDAWLAAQNGGDFATYGGLYAEKFDGVKRAGNRTFRFNRAKWLDDRGKMFRRKMTVEVDTVAIHPMRTAAMIRFNQRWTGGRFSDYGPKEILAVRENGALRIAREEMLRSEESAVQAPGGAAFRDGFFPVLEGRYAVIDVAPKATARGALPLNRNTAVKAVPVGERSEALKKLLHSELIVGFADGTVETRSVARAVYTAVYIVHFGTAQQWAEQRMSDAEIAAELWGAARSSGSVYLALELKPGKSAPLWAAVSRSAPEVYSVSEADSEALLRVMTAASKTAPFQRIQNEFRTEGGSGSWETQSRIECRAFDGKGGRFYALSVSAGMGCGDFYGSYHGIFVEKNGKTVYLGYPEDFAVPDFVDDHDAYLAVDIDKDGFPEFIGERKILYRDGGVWKIFETPVPFGDCPC